MTKEEIKRNIELMLSQKLDKNIPCCEDSTHDYDAYNNIENMYSHDKNKYKDITVFNEFNPDMKELAMSLGVDEIALNNLFHNRHIPSKGLASAIGMALGLDIDKMNSVLNDLGYSFNKTDYDRIIEYFFINKIYDINMLNEILLEFGQMYLYSKRKLR